MEDLHRYLLEAIILAHTVVFGYKYVKKTWTEDENEKGEDDEKGSNDES